MKILVVHPGKQYVHQLIYALSEFSEVTFLTSYWLQPEKLFYRILKVLPFPGKKNIIKQLNKRYFSPIQGVEIIEYPLPEIKRLVKTLFVKDFEEPVFKRDRAFDSWASKKVHQINPDIVIGYEMACCETFMKARELGKTTILDLAQIHYQEIENLGEKYPVFGSLFKNKNLRLEINKVKEKEIQLADNILTLSDFAKQSMLNHGVPGSKLLKINIGFDPSIFKAKESYKRGEKFRYIFVGTITKRKGIDILINAFTKLKLESAELVLVGPATDAGDIIPKDNPAITHIPFATHNELNSILNKADVFVFPSYLDSWAMVVIEAMACGLPVIVTKYTGASDAVKYGGGFIIEPEINLLIEKMKYFYEQPEVVEKLGKEARKVAENYTWENYRKEVQKGLSKLQTPIL